MVLYAQESGLSPVSYSNPRDYKLSQNPEIESAELAFLDTETELKFGNSYIADGDFDFFAMEEATVFTFSMKFLRDRFPEEKETMVKFFTITPLCWALVTDNGFEGNGYGKRYSPQVWEHYVCLTSNQKTSKSYLISLNHSLTDHEWIVNRMCTEDQFVPGILEINSKTNFLTQLTSFLKILDFGPNHWATAETCSFGKWQCVFLKLLLSEADRKHFSFPFLSKENKNEYRNLYETKEIH